MKIKLGILFIFCLITFFTNANKAIFLFDKSSFYSALSANKTTEIDEQLTLVKASTIAEKNAYEGVLLMKKAGLVSKPKDKINLFKEGRSKLEKAIKKEEDNTEYRFLRLIIQENAPKIVNYKSDLDKDALLIKNNYKTLPQALQHFVMEYSKKSKLLKGI